VAKANASDPRTRVLRSLHRRRFERFRYRGTDALVARVPKGGPLPPTVRARLAERSDVRIYPVPGGFLYKWPHSPGGVSVAGFEVEVGGWDNEHCDACGRIISVGGTAWLTIRGSAAQICPYCYRRIGQLGAGKHS
jgi:hypothetical protein